MARVLLFDSSLSVVSKVLYSVDAAVGRGGANRRDDVLLVQFFLKVISEAIPDFQPDGIAPLPTTGTWATMSQAYLDRYIQVENERNPDSLLVVDGRVDPMVSGTLTGSISGTIYTMAALNRRFQFARSDEALDDITTDPLFPPDLRSSLKI